MKPIFTADEKWCLYVNTKRSPPWVDKDEQHELQPKAGLHPLEVMISTCCLHVTSEMLPPLVPLLVYCSIVEASRYYHTNEDALHFSNNEDGPRIDRHSFFKQHFRLGYKLRLFCEAHGTPRPDLRWYKNGVEVKTRPGLWIRNSVDLDTVSSHLDIDPARVLDAGEYECVANNSYGYHLEHMRAHIRL
ncbi:hypothetical protein Y032_0025g1270 [Ancylostoma ceylanicum]|uniref:Ig-like domain-containing protein n=1 Tax=Ancylostoma ceylanicum TaxID=53326 RepID=A0A016UUZ3_9BILA|nr:hypothetical protein Y032_0025g1270 [Ancylostoma ceylanicum]